MHESSLAGPTDQSARPPLSTLFLICFKIGLTSFGGGVTGWMYQDLVVRRGWIKEDDFAASLAMAQMLPGTNVVNLLIGIGSQMHGLKGASFCVAGVLAGPFMAVLGLSLLFDQFGDSPILSAASQGVAAAVVGLMLQLGIRSVQRAWSHWPALAAIVITAVSVGLLLLPLVPVVLVVAPVSVALAWRRK